MILKTEKNKAIPNDIVSVIVYYSVEKHRSQATTKYKNIRPIIQKVNQKNGVAKLSTRISRLKNTIYVKYNERQ